MHNFYTKVGDDLIQLDIEMKKIKKFDNQNLIPVERLERQIFLIRGQKVMFDFDLAELYQVPVKVLNQAVKRNLDRFPKDFMFQLTKEESENWKSQIIDSRSQIVTLNMRPQIVTTSSSRFQIGTLKRGQNVKYFPYVFTEHGVAMLSSVLRSKRAVQMNILIVRAFVKLREIILSNKELANRMEKVEATQKKHASVIGILANEINKMKRLPPEKPKEPIGFVPKK